MKDALYFKAQALDNTSPDLYQYGDSKVVPDEGVMRQQITDLISDISRRGSHHLRADGAELIVVDRAFLVQVSCRERDDAGRRASIICCGEFSRDDDPAEQSILIVGAIREFAARIERTVEPCHLKAIDDNLGDLKKKPTNRGIPIWVVLTLSIVALLILLLTY
ncbi:hypothetical protein [Sphingomonas sp. SKA58]|uniref:hypothetical protein n=1 Tax=Sphingomonas sp. (strain SKA58) TaxID=314266 RepID=UPI0012EA3F34|nr:hypothetical protein [Sphingomonas sp. SKA58]